MARKTRAELHEQYAQRIDRARRWRDQEGYTETWRRLNDLYRGKHWPRTTAAERDLIAVNLSFSTVNVIAPSVVIISRLSLLSLDRNQFYHRLRHNVGLVRHSDYRHQALDRPNTIDYQ